MAARPHLRVLPPLAPDDLPEPGAEAGTFMAAFLAAAPDRATDPGAWAAGLVTAYREDQPPLTPKNAAQAVAKLGVGTCLLTLIAWGEDAAVAPPHLAALMDARKYLGGSRGKLVRKRVEAVASAPAGPGLVPVLARLLSAAAVAKSGGDAARLVTEAIAHLARARGVVAVHAALRRSGERGS